MAQNPHRARTAARQAAEARLLRPQRARGRARPDRRDPAGQRRRRHHRRGRGLSSHRSGRAFVQRADAAQPGDVRPARLRLRLSLLRHPLVRQFRLREGRLGQRGADPRACSRPTASQRCGAGADCTTSGRCAPGRASCARRSPSPTRTTACRSIAADRAARTEVDMRGIDRHHQGGDCLAYG